MWSTVNKLLDFGHISWFQFSTLKKTSSPTKPKAARRSDPLLTLFLFRLQAVSDQRLIYAGKLLPDNLHINGLFIQVCMTARAFMSSGKCHKLIMCHYAGDKLVEKGCFYLAAACRRIRKYTVVTETCERAVPQKLGQTISCFFVQESQ